MNLEGVSKTQRTPQQNISAAVRVYYRQDAHGAAALQHNIGGEQVDHVTEKAFEQGLDKNRDSEKQANNLNFDAEKASARYNFPDDLPSLTAKPSSDNVMDATSPYVRAELPPGEAAMNAKDLSVDIDKKIYEAQEKFGRLLEDRLNRNILSAVESIREMIINPRPNNMPTATNYQFPEERHSRRPSSSFEFLNVQNNPQTRQEPISNNAAPSVHQNINNQPQISSHYQPTPRIAINKWNIIFSGYKRAMTVEEFIFRVEHLVKIYRCPESVLLSDFHTLLKDDADAWYWLYLQTNEEPHWSALKDAMTQQFSHKRSHYELMCELNERKQKPDESIDSYFQAMIKLRARIIAYVSEYELVKIIKMNVKDQISRIVYPMSIHAVEQLRHECKEAEHYLSKRDSRYSKIPMQSTIQRPHRVHELELETEQKLHISSPPEADLEALNGPVLRNQLICWNCNQEGHGYKQCSANFRKIFCYACGKEGVKTIMEHNCPAEIRRRNVRAVVDSRSSQTATARSNQESQRRGN